MITELSHRTTGIKSDSFHKLRNVHRRDKHHSYVYCISYQFSSQTPRVPFDSSLANKSIEEIVDNQTV